MKSEAGASRGSTIKFALDSNCLVAMLADWHPRHRVTVAAYERRVTAGQKPVIAGHALFECFSVLTRLPGPVRVAPEVADRALKMGLADVAEIATLPPGDCWALIHNLGQSGRGGGLVYDALIAWESFSAGATSLLTWNLSDMLTVAPPGLRITEP